MTQSKVDFTDGTLVNGDCADAIGDISDNSVDLIFTSPPYCVGKPYDHSRQIEDFLDQISNIQSTLYDKLRDGGSLCWQIGSHVRKSVVTPLDYLVHQVCQDFPALKLRNRIVWTFEHGEHATNRLSGRHEVVLWYTKGDKYHFDLDPIRIPQKYPGKKHYKGPNRGKLSGNPLGKNPGDVWPIPNVKANHVEKTKHPCQFPVALVCRFVKALSPKNGQILDPFAGSASTAIAALETGRKFCCIEIDQRYFGIAKKRIEDWYEGKRKVRDDIPIAVPNPRASVAIRPAHFLSRNIE